MTPLAELAGASLVGAERPAPRALLQASIEHAAHFLPAQGPINVFIHHNTLHAFEHLPFDEGVQAGAKLFGCEPYLSEDKYRAHLAHDRIRLIDLTKTLDDDLRSGGGERIARLVSRRELRLAMLEYPLRTADPSELRWFVAQTDALAKFRPVAPRRCVERMVEETRHWVQHDLAAAAAQSATTDDALADLLSHEWSALIGDALRNDDQLARLLREVARDKEAPRADAAWESLTLRLLWRICYQGVQGLPARSPAERPLRHRDAMLELTGVDADLAVNELLIRFCSAFLDQGLSQWMLPERDAGFWRSFAALYAFPGGPPDAWLRPLRAELQRIERAGLAPEDVILESLAALGVNQDEWSDFITATFLALRGWPGMIWQMEVRGDRASYPVPEGSLVEYLAVRLLLERISLTYVAQSAGVSDDLRRMRNSLPVAARGNPAEERAFHLFHLAQVLGWLPSELFLLSKQEWHWLVSEIEAFPEIERRRVFHAAFERRYREQVLDAIALHAAHRLERVAKPRFQVICCLDEREESFRRHLEEIAPDVETFGAAGFFGVAMYYRGAAEAHYVPLCPIVIRPQHWVAESAVYALDETHRRRATTRRWLGAVSHELHRGSRTFAGGAFLTAGLGALASIPMVARVLFPRLTARVRRTASRLVESPSITQLELERSSPEPGSADGQIGFTLDEMTNMCERLLVDIGLTNSFARVVLWVGHGSNSLNNPHKSAYDCGACGGNCGGPNARAIARMLNDPRVRERLKQRDLRIPDDTWFVGSWHNTCNDEVTYFDLDRLPASHRKEFERVEEEIEQTCQRNAHERCRRFVSAPLNMSFKGAKRHVEGRAEDLAQTRPECGHATNAVCYVGRRSRVRGLYMDRRTFLTSYDPTQDTPDQAVLLRILQAAVPVCGGINLEYYFSYVDNIGFGCGTKLPHNITSLLGIMDGAASDLRTGLPWQMVEIHEPVRLLFVIESSPEAMLRIMEKNEVIGRMCRHGWVQVATLDPSSDRLHLLEGDRFAPYAPTTAELPHSATSADWYRGWRDHLGFAVITGHGEEA